MKNAALFFLTIVVQIILNAQSGPVFTAKDVIDFGTIYSDLDSGVRHLEFTNTGNEPLVFHEVKSSCGCLVPYWPREPFPPGKSGVIKVKYNITRIGPINKTITITTNEIDSMHCEGYPIYKSHTVKVLGKVLSPPGPYIQSYQYNRIYFGSVYGDEDSGIRLYEVTNEGTKDLIFGEVTSTNQYLTAETPSVIKPNETGYVKIIYNMKKTGTFEANISIGTNQAINVFPLEFLTLDISVTGNILLK